MVVVMGKCIACGEVDDIFTHACPSMASLRHEPYERTPDGHPRVWLLYRPEPWAFDSDDERSIHLWVRRCDVFTSRAAAAAFLDNLLGRQVTWRPYDELFPELWVGEDRERRWLMCPAPLDPPGGGQ